MVLSYPTTDARGSALAEQVLDVIEAEERFRQQLRPNHAPQDDDDLIITDKHSVWYQNLWADVQLNKLPAGTYLEPLPQGVKEAEALTSYWKNKFHRLATIDSGVSCGTAMCFAGHAATLAGDKLIVALPEGVTQPLHEGKPRKNVRRWLNSLRRKLGYGDQENFGEDFGLATDLVLTSEGEVMEISKRARQLLGLTEAEADRLFGGYNTLEDLRKYVRRISEGKYISNGAKRRVKTQ